MARKIKVQDIKIKYQADMSPSERKLYRETIKQVNETNRRLARLEKGIDLNKATYNPRTGRYERKNKITVGGKTIKQTDIYKSLQGSWASKKLTDKISKFYNANTNRITINGANMTDIRAINKATSNFLDSLTSTLEGISKVQENTKQGLENLLGDIEGIDSEDIDTFYSFYSDSDYKDVTQYIDPSELNVLMAYYKGKNDSTETFLEKIKMYNESVYADEDLKKGLVRLYNKLKV